MPNPPVLWDIESDPALAGTKLIAEAWDAAGLYQVGSFVGDAWKEWNGRFRDDVRDFFRGEPGSVRRGWPTGCVGSPEIYGHKEREAEQSINFVTCHDGFTLNDLVSYNQKHNEANGEDNRDGANDNTSWNCGIEGPTDDPAVEELRNRQVKNFLDRHHAVARRADDLMGDEVRRTQHGNNNAYCHDDEIELVRLEHCVEKHADVLSLRPTAHRPPAAARRRARTAAGQPERTDSRTRTKPGTASNSTSPTGATSSRLLGIHGGAPQGKNALSPDFERLLGSA